MANQGYNYDNYDYGQEDQNYNQGSYNQGSYNQTSQQQQQLSYSDYMRGAGGSTYQASQQ